MATLMIMVKKSEANTLDIGSGSKRVNLKSFINLLQQLRLGCAKGTVYVNSSSTDPVFASQTATLTYGSISDQDTVVIAGTTLTAVTGTPTAGIEFKKQTNATVTAANMVIAVNANTTLNKYIFASSAAGVVTLTCLYPGTIGNLLTLVGSTGIAAGAATFALGAGGAASTQHTYSFT